MTTFFNANLPVRPQDAAGHGVGNNRKSATGEFKLSAALTLNQVIPMVAIPRGARITGGRLSCDDLDTNGAPTIVLAVGDTGDDDRYLTASNIGQAGGNAYFDRHIGHGHRFAESGTIDVKVTTAPATGATTGTIRLTVDFIVD